jgi:manganese transport protein
VSPAVREPDVVLFSGEASPEHAGASQINRHLQRRGVLSVLPFLGPAFVAGVAYIDPGNFATNLVAGARFGYQLLWVVLASNLIAMLVQHLSAKLGIATGCNLPETIHKRWPRPLSLGLWVVAEVAAIATDFAEFLGGALGINLLFGIPLFPAALVTAAATIAILWLERFGYRPIEAVIGSLVAVIAVCYVIETFLSRPDWHQVALHSFLPSLSGAGIYLALGILGATVMPHVVYLHSALTQGRIRATNDQERRRLLRFNGVDVVVAMALAGLVNLSMLYMAAATFHAHGLFNVADLRDAYRTLAPLLGSASSKIFGLSLLVSGIASSSVGTLAGQVIMKGFVGRSFPLWVRRAVTMIPPLIVIYLNLPTAETLVISQVILSAVLPFAVIPLVWFTSQRRVMGILVNRRYTVAAASACAVLIIALNAALVYRVALG